MGFHKWRTLLQITKNGCHFTISFILVKIVHHTELTPETIKEYLLENTNNVALDTIITDGNLAYPNIIKELGADHSPCHFHFIDKYLKKYWAEQRKLNNKIKTNENKIESIKQQNNKNKDHT